MSEMVERVARAIAENQHQGWLYDQEAVAMLDPERVAKARKFLREAARAAIEAMREPTLEMIEAGQMENNLLENPDPPNAFLFLSRAEIKGAWEAMLEAALSPSGEK